MSFAAGSMAARVDGFLSDPASGGSRTFTMDQVKFPFNSPKLNSAAYPQMDNLVKILQTYPDARVEFVGYIDGGESDVYTGPYGNGEITLSAIRARCLYRKLIEHGISASRLSFRGAGASTDRRLEAVVSRR